MKCPRCQSAITASPDPSGYIVCSSCGARLRRAAHVRSAPAAEPARPEPAFFPDGSNPNLTLPPGTKIPDIGRRTAVAAAAAAAAPALDHLQRDDDPVATPSSGAPVRATNRSPGESTARMRAVSFAAPGAAPASVAPSVSLGEIYAELQDVRRVQEQILALLRTGSRPAADESMGDSTGFGLGEPARVPALRSGRRKSVLVIDDDEATRSEVVAAFGKSEVPVRTVADGNAALAAIAEDKPDVIVMELAIGGPMAGKDVVNMIKATMEWVDVPILLYTRLPVESQKEARTVHGADDFVLKGAGAPEAVVAKTITFFRKL